MLVGRACSLFCSKNTGWAKASSAEILCSTLTVSIFSNRSFKSPSSFSIFYMSKLNIPDLLLLISSSLLLPPNTWALKSLNKPKSTNCKRLLQGWRHQFWYSELLLWKPLGQRSQGCHIARTSTLQSLDTKRSQDQ